MVSDVAVGSSSSIIASAYKDISDGSKAVPGHEVFVTVGTQVCRLTYNGNTYDKTECSLSTAGPPSNGKLSAVQFNNPQGISSSPDGRTFIADTGNHVIRMISDQSQVTEFSLGTDVEKI